MVPHASTAAVDHRLVVLLAAHVGADEQRLRAGRRRQLVGGGAARSPRSISAIDDACALLGEAAGDAGADAVARRR